MILNRAFFVFLNIIILNTWNYSSAFSQNCDVGLSKKQQKIYDKAWEYQNTNQYGAARENMFQLSKEAPECAKVQMSLGIFYLENNQPSVKTAKKYLEKSVELCKDSVLYSYFYLGKIYYGAKDFEKAINCFEHFLEDVDQIKTDEDYFEIKNYLEYAKVTQELLSHPVPFEPKKVEGISTKADEYLPIISPDNEFALFTRRVKQFQNRGLTERMVEREIFTFSMRNQNGVFEPGWELEHPFNKVENEGAATLTIDNNDLYYTVCVRDPQTKYLNCDLYHSHYNNGYWSDIESLGDHINSPDSWESQPSVTSDGQTIFFASNRDGGLGGYDIYKTNKQEDGSWSEPINVGAPINTPGNEKSPFIHTDSQTLYFSSEGHKGLGGYDIFFSRHDENNRWMEPKNIGYPINSFDDDLGFFVSTDGYHGYYSSNRFDENNKWNLYTFPLYEEARPQKVLFIKGTVDVENNQEPIRARVQLKNMETKTITEIQVDTNTGKYVAAVLFREDQVLTVKKEGYVYSSRYLSVEDTTLEQPKTVNLEVKEIKVGHEYEIDDIYFTTNSFELNEDARKIIDEFFEFLSENENIEVEIQGHTDNIGQNEANLTLSHNRAQSVYQYLIDRGIDANRLSYQGYGESKPVASNETWSGRAKNRRTVFLIKNR
jgi:outer membrane protein OmpA-like peptidoglycan-associated protein